MKRNMDEVIEYVEEQNGGKCKVISAKIESSFDDLEFEVNVWNVKTDTARNWWVVEGEELPMNLYSQDALYLTSDEVYSFHIGLMSRMMKAREEYTSEDYIKAATLGIEITPVLLRKLRNTADQLESAKEVEDFQAIGVQCREILIELGNAIYKLGMEGEEEQPQKSNFKKKAELFIKFYLNDSENSDYRSYLKKITEATWDYANKITHSQNTTIYEASTCIALIISLVSIYENIQHKIFDPISQFICKNCKSKKVTISGDEHGEDSIVTKLYIKCEECGEITEVTKIGYSKNERTDNNNYRNGHYPERTVATEMGDIPVKVPRDRNGEIDSDLVPKYSRTANGFDEKVISMYALGMSDKDIQEQIKEIFGCNLSPDMISDITDKIIPEVQEWQKRKLESVIY